MARGGWTVHSGSSGIGIDGGLLGELDAGWGRKLDVWLLECVVDVEYAKAEVIFV